MRADGADRRLASYGTLAPGRANHHQLDGLRGTWVPGLVRGVHVPEGCAATLGYPALWLDSAGPAVEVSLFTSADLPAHWDRLDAFEGEGYRRVVATVATAAGDLAAFIYVAAAPR